MTRHEDVYYTCNGCGNRLNGDRTEITATNTDPAAQDPVHEYDLCAKCWLDIYPIINKVAIEAKRQADLEMASLYRGRDELRPWDD